VQGRSLPQFVEQEISGPAGLPDLALGLGARDAGSVAFSYWLGKDRLMVSGLNVAADFEKGNNSSIQFESLNPAVSLVTNAASLAAFYEFLLADGVARTGRRVISAETLRRYTTRNVIGLERSSRAVSCLARGFFVVPSSPRSTGGGTRGPASATSAGSRRWHSETTRPASPRRS